MAYKDFINDFNKGIIGDALCFFGAEDFLIDLAINQIVDKYLDESAKDVDFQNLDGENVTAADIISVASSYSMFSKKRVVVVKNFLPIYKKTMEADEDLLLNFCSKKNESTILIFTLKSELESKIVAFGKKLIKTCNSYEFSRLDKADLKSFINKRVSKAGKLLGHREMEYLIELSGYYNKDSNYSLSDFNRDIAKIINATSENQISNETIQDLLLGEDDRYFFNLFDALMSGKKGRAMEIAEATIKEEGFAVQMLGLFTSQFEIMYDSLELSKRGMSFPEMAKKIGVHEFRLKKAFQAARQFSLEKLKNILIKIYNIDRDFKTGNIDVNTAIELLIISI